MKPQGLWQWADFLGGLICLSVIAIKLTADTLGHSWPVTSWDVFASYWAATTRMKYQ